MSQTREDAGPDARAALDALLGGRMGHPPELAGMAVLLASRASAFMTGAVLPVDGGTLIAYPV